MLCINIAVLPFCKAAHSLFKSVFNTHLITIFVFFVFDFHFWKEFFRWKLENIYRVSDTIFPFVFSIII